ncbi:MAG TPA: hydantoinase/oxoprolinase family protein [Pseudolabrys sp.]|nr:hydantoinase/oxoprolinase family protein [Pseudolabrys sp.]
MAGGIRIGVDIGGTFTDFTLVDPVSGVVRVEKILTSTDAAERSVLEGIDRFGSNGSNGVAGADGVIHATTLVTNTILERKGALTALVTTAGFRDLLEIQREVRYDLYDLFIEMPQPVVPRRLRFGVPERILADGSVRQQLDEEALRDIAAQLREAKVEAVAVVFLHSYRNNIHERRAGEILAEELPGVVVSLSHQVHPEPKEYERASTTVLDAYVKRTMEGYLDLLTDGLKQRGYRQKLFIMLSNGGTTTAENAKAVPIQLVESGPAAGVEAASYFGRNMGIDRILSFDMGGTTAKLCIVENGRAERARMFEVDRVKRFKAGSGLPVAVPVYDLLEIGAGGGSIARINSLGLLQVGPDSAGASPGPVSYGLGGTEPTVTDADLVLGHLGANSFLGGDMPLDLEAARRAMNDKLAAPTGLSVERVASGIFEIVNETMASAARQYVAEKALAPSELTMIAFGGAGPVHALGLARKLGCPRVVIPPFPGVMSSLGLLAAPVAFERSHAVKRLSRDVAPADLEALFSRLAADARALLPAEASPVVTRFADLRYAGQDHTLEVTLSADALDEAAIARMGDDFVAQYHDLYGKIDDDNPLEIASVRVVLSEQGSTMLLPVPTAASPAAPSSTRRFVEADGSIVDAPVFARGLLPVGQTVEGPALIEERESTTVLGRGDRMTVDASGALVIEVALPTTNEDAVPRRSAENV